jgi:hypothetical protein
VILLANKNAWVTAFERLVLQSLMRDVKLSYGKKGIPFRILLLLGSAHVHPQHLNDFYPAIKTMYLPPNTTCLLQPMDQSVICSFKVLYTSRTIHQQVKSTEKDMSKTLKFSYDLVLDIGCRWHEVKSTTLNSAWKKVRAPFVNDLVGFDDFLGEKKNHS